MDNKEYNSELCDNCQIHPITQKDFRPDGAGGMNKVYVCGFCATLDSEWYYRVGRDNLCPKAVLEIDCDCEKCSEEED